MIEAGVPLGVGVTGGEGFEELGGVASGVGWRAAESGPDGLAGGEYAEGDQGGDGEVASARGRGGRLGGGQESG